MIWCQSHEAETTRGIYSLRSASFKLQDPDLKGYYICVCFKVVLCRIILDFSVSGDDQMFS